MSDVAACYKCNSSEYGSGGCSGGTGGPGRGSGSGCGAAAIVATVAVIAEARLLDNYYL